MYSSRNRSACVRIPVQSKARKAKRIEFRAPDPMANPYLAFAACMMAGIDGIQNKIEPPKPMDKDLYELPPAEKKGIAQTPGSLRLTLEALKNDHDFLLKGDVFTKDLIETYIDYKLTAECDAINYVGLDSVQLVVVPEPASVLSLGLAGLVLMRRRR